MLPELQFTRPPPLPPDGIPRAAGEVLDEVGAVLAVGRRRLCLASEVWRRVRQGGGGGVVVIPPFPSHMCPAMSHQCHNRDIGVEGPSCVLVPTHGYGVAPRGHTLLSMWR